MDVTIRDAGVADAEVLISLILGGKLTTADGSDGRDGPEHLDAYVDAIGEIEADPNSTVLVACGDDGRVVAMLQLFTFRHVQHRGGRCGEIESMHVRDDLRGSGIGSVLLDEAVRRADDIGCYRVQLTSNSERPDAHRFYARHGFVASHRGFKRYL